MTSVHSISHSAEKNAGEAIVFLTGVRWRREKLSIVRHCLTVGRGLNGHAILTANPKVSDDFCSLDLAQRGAQRERSARVLDRSSWRSRCYGNRALEFRGQPKLRTDGAENLYSRHYLSAGGAARNRQRRQLETAALRFYFRFTLKQTLSLSFCCLLYTSPSPRDSTQSRMPSSA